MGKTWGEIKSETLKKMFSYSNNGAIATTGNEDYLLAMPEVANYALRDLAANCRPLVRRYSLSHVPVPNMLGDTVTQFRFVQSVGDDIIYTAGDPKAFYFEVDNPCTAVLELLDNGSAVPIRTITHASKGAFTAYSDLIANTGTIRLRFVGGNAYNIRNVAFYGVPFPSAADIPPYTRSDRYNLKTLIGATFMKLPPNAVTVTGDGAYRKNDEYLWEDDCTLVIDHFAVAQYDILYNAYPTKITSTTEESFVLELSDEALDIVPLYMAGQLFMEDNPGMATSWLNQYAVRRAELSNDQEPLGRNEWHSETGWW